MIETFLANGIDLDDNPMGTHLLDSSSPRAGIERRTTTVTGGRRSGNTAVPQADESPVLVLVVRVPQASEDAFLALMGSASMVLGHRGWAAPAELLGVAASLGFNFTDYSCTFRIPAMFWRDLVVTTSSTAIGAASITADVFPTLTAPVRDAIVRIKGGVTNPRFTDSNGSYFQYTGVLPATSWLRFEAATGRAFTSTADVWAGGTQVTNLISNGPSAYPLELTPYFVDPTVRVARFTLTTSARTGTPTVEVRGKRAYRV